MEQLRTKIGYTCAVLIIIFTALMQGWVLYEGAQLVGKPFPGFLYLTGHKFNVWSLPHWTGSHTTAHWPFQIKTINGKKIDDDYHFIKEVRSRPVGTVFTLSLIHI